MKFKVGDRVEIVKTNVEPTRHPGEMGTILDTNGADAEYLYLVHPDSFRSNTPGGLYCKIKEAKMSIKEKIENINEDTTIKELDDLLTEIAPAHKILYKQWEHSESAIAIIDAGACRVGSDAPLVVFQYSDQCSKLKALKDALLWLAKKTGKLKDNKKELEEVKGRMEDYRELYERTMEQMKEELERLKK